MKKLLLIIGVLLFLPNMVFADMGSPAIEPYDATISNKNGAVVYNDEYKPTSKKLEYGTSVHVNYEEDGFAFLSDPDGVVKSVDLTAKNYKMDLSKWGNLTTGIILKKTEVKSGPALAYEKVGELEAYTKVSVRLGIGEDNGATSWIYVDSGNVKGFVDGANGSIAYSPKIVKFITYQNTDLLDPQTEKSTETINPNTLLTVTMYEMSPWARSYYIEYNGKKGVVEQTIALEHEDVEVTVNRDINIYESLNGEEKSYKKVGVAKKGTKFTCKYSDGFNGTNMLYYDNGIKGWILDIDDEEKGGFALSWEFPESYISEPVENTQTPDNTKTEPTEQTPDNTKTDPVETNPTDVEPKQNKVPERVYLYIALGVCACLTAVVIILLINKKKKGY